MAQRLFTAELGYSIDDLVSFLPSDGTPGGDAGVQDAAAVGSLALDYTNGKLYQKTSSGSGADKWTEQSSKLTASWREPVRVVDTATWATLSAAETELNDTSTPGALGGVDSDQFADGDRILLTDLTTGTETVYIVTGTPGSAATLTADSNTPTDGDVLFVQEGTSADSQWAYNGASWFQVGGTSSDELGYLRAFVGKTAAGSETPSYSSSVYVGATDNLEVAVGKLDAGLAEARTETTQSTVTTAVTQDSVLVDSVDVARWVVVAKSGANVRVEEVIAVHDGHSGADAANVDYSVYGKLKLGTVTGFDATVDLNGTGAAQEMRLRVTSTTSVDVKAFRTAI